jgi:hypothetical protein
MVSPTTLSFSVLALVLGDRPLRTGFLFFLGAFTVTIVIGVVAAFVLGNTASSHKPRARRPGFRFSTSSLPQSCSSGSPA